MDDYLSISALQHYAYCPRQCALIHVEQVWDENRWTAEGRILHERVDSGAAEQRKNVRYERGVMLVSHRYRLKGKMDLLEIETGDPHRYFPVEYKRGKPKVQDWDRIQICAQALCLEEMRAVEVGEGAIWYWQVRRREPVVLDSDLRGVTNDTIEAAGKMLASGQTPPPVNDQRCKSCSLVDICRPSQFVRDRSGAYMEDVFAE